MSQKTDENKGPQQLALEAEFPPEMLDTVQKGGDRITYVPVHEVIARFNDVLGVCGWEWETVDVHRDATDPDFVVAYGHLTATVDGRTARKSGEGGVKVKRTRKGEIIDLGDEFKGAGSEAFKKGGQRFGVGLYLSRDPAARHWEAPRPARDAVEEGWESADRQREWADDLASKIKQLPEDAQQRLRDRRKEIGIDWPPTRDQWVELNDAFERERATVQPTPEAPDSAGEAMDAKQALTDAFPGAKDVTPPPQASDKQIEAIKNYLKAFEMNDAKPATIAYRRYLKNMGVSEPEQLTEEQADKVLDFMEGL